MHHRQSPTRRVLIFTNRECGLSAAKCLATPSKQPTHGCGKDGSRLPAAMKKELVMVGGEPLACRDAVARAGGAGPGGLAPSVYGHGRDAVGQLCDNSLQSASLWGVMGALTRTHPALNLSRSKKCLGCQTPRPAYITYIYCIY